MTIAITISVLAGMAVGFRFKIYMVVPVILTAALSIAALAIAQGDTIWSATSSLFLSAIGVQIGYLCGTFALSMKEMPTQDVAPAQAPPSDAYGSRTEVSV